MSTIQATGHRFGKHSPAEQKPERPLFRLVTPSGEFLHESGTALTVNRAYAWQGNRDQMRNMLETLNEGLRAKLRPMPLSQPRPAGRA